jgi:uncharacterized spore protein YtfJ
METNTNLDHLLATVTDFLKNEANSETVIGKPFQLGEYSCVPVIKIGLGFGYGTGEQKSKDQAASGGVGGGAGVGIAPIGFLCSHGKDISFVPANNSKLSSLFEKVPELIEKYMAAQAKKEKAA